MVRYIEAEIKDVMQLNPLPPEVRIVLGGLSAATRNITH